MQQDRTEWMLAGCKAVLKKKPGGTGQPQVEHTLGEIMFFFVIT